MLENGYEYYKGFYIIQYNKIVFGINRTMYRVEQYDTKLFTSKSIDECRKFCDDFSKAFGG